MKKIYIAGQHVFHKDVAEISLSLKSICEEYGLEGLFPMDNKCITADEIFECNINLIKDADFIVAYVEPFRGISIDPGTAMEIGFARALNKPIYAYKEDHSEYKKRAHPSEEYPLVEDFGLGENLMIEKACSSINNSFLDCIIKISSI